MVPGLGQNDSAALQVFFYVFFFPSLFSYDIHCRLPMIALSSPFSHIFSTKQACYGGPPPSHREHRSLPGSWFQHCPGVDLAGDPSQRLRQLAAISGALLRSRRSAMRVFSHSVHAHKHREMGIQCYNLRYLSLV